MRNTINTMSIDSLKEFYIHNLQLFAVQANKIATDRLIQLVSVTNFTCDIKTATTHPNGNLINLLSSSS